MDERYHVTYPGKNLEFAVERTMPSGHNLASDVVCYVTSGMAVDQNKTLKYVLI